MECFREFAEVGLSGDGKATEFLKGVLYLAKAKGSISFIEFHSSKKQIRYFCSESLPVSSRGRHLDRRIQEAAKTPVKELSSPLGFLGLQSVSQLLMGKCRKNPDSNAESFWCTRWTEMKKCLLP